VFTLIFTLSMSAMLAKTPVTLSGCAREGTTPGTFMLMNLHQLVAGREQPVPVDANGRDVLYQLTTSKGLTDGQRVEVIGTIDLGNAEDAELKVTKKNSAKRQVTTSEITTQDAQVTVLTGSAGQAVRAQETDRTIYRLKVKSVRAQGPCHATWVTFPAAADKP
jgi:hypothetical protein